VNRTPLEVLLRRDRLIVTVGLVLAAGVAWLYLFVLTRGMSEVDMAMPQVHAWELVDVLLVFVMWAVMMVAMMLPTAAPLILMFSAVYRRRSEQHRPVVSTGVFVFGYLSVWCAYAGLATLAQWGLHTAALLSATIARTSPRLGGLLLMAAGAFQWTPLKRVCLARCRSPLSFLMTEWREGTAGTLGMGLSYGASCVGCCWVLMVLLFVAGVMNLAWVAAIATFVLIEKVLPHGERISRIGGVGLLVAGLFMLLRA
jgi:predicted metal-binding membrane protein